MADIEERVPLHFTEEQVEEALDLIDWDKFAGCLPHPPERATFDDTVHLDHDSLDWDEAKQTGQVRIWRDWSLYVGCKDMDDSGEEEDYLNLSVDDGHLVVTGSLAEPRERSTEDEL